MNCPNCGTSNPDTASLCANCGRPLATTTPHSYTPPPPSGSNTSYTPPRPPGGGSYGAPPPVERIPNYLVPSILTLCCCWPVSPGKSYKYSGARDASAKAKMFCWIAFGIGLAGWLIWSLTGGMAIFETIREGMANR